MNALRQRTFTALAGLALALAGSGCNDVQGPDEGLAGDFANPSEPEEDEGPDTFGKEKGVDVDDLLNQDPDQYIGKTVRVSAEIADVIGGSAFVLSAPEDQVPGLLVVSAKAPFSAGSLVRVTGTVRIFEPGMQQEFGFELTDEQLAAFDGVPVIVATKVTPTVPEETDDNAAPPRSLRTEVVA